MQMVFIITKQAGHISITARKPILYSFIPFEEFTKMYKMVPGILGLFSDVRLYIVILTYP